MIVEVYVQLARNASVSISHTIQRSRQHRNINLSQTGSLKDGVDTRYLA
jgi:hypothetical protein